MTEIGYRRTGPADGPDMEAAAEKWGKHWRMS